MDFLKRELPAGEVLEDRGLRRANTPDGAVAAGYDLAGVVTQSMIPENREVIEVVSRHACDPKSSLFRPYRFNKAGVYAKQVLKGETLQMNSRQVPSLDTVQYAFTSPWKRIKNDCCHVAEGDYLAIILKPTSDFPNGEIYRIPKASCEWNRHVVQRYFQLCSICGDERSDCSCGDGKFSEFKLVNEIPPEEDGATPEEVGAAPEEDGAAPEEICALAQDLKHVQKLHELKKSIVR